MTVTAETKAAEGARANDLMVSLEEHYRIEQFLYAESTLLDEERIRTWLDTVVDPAIRYQMVIPEVRHARDKTPQNLRELMIYDDDLTALKLRVRQFETGLQRMMDPRQYVRRFISNVRAVQTGTEGQYEVTSYGKAYRFRREYDKDEVVYQRTDLIARGGDVGFRLLKRRIDLFERVIRSKNLLFFL